MEQRNACVLKMGSYGKRAVLCYFARFLRDVALVRWGTSYVHSIASHIDGQAIHYLVW